MRFLVPLVVLGLLLVACPAAVQGGEPDSYLGPKPVRRGTEAYQPSDLRQALQTGSNWTSLLLNGYLTNAQLATWTSDYVTRCSSIARSFSIGKSVQGVDLLVVEIAAKPGVVEAKPNFKYVANMHGDETSGRMMLPMLAEWLCANQNDPRASRIINGMHLFLLPTMNPDGFDRNSRSNGAGADLNRNFPSFSRVSGCTNKPPEQCSASKLISTSGVQPEVAAIMRWSLNPSFPFAFAANMHEGAVVANYPWDGYNDGSTAVRGIVNPSPDDAAYKFLSKVYSRSHTTMSFSSSFTDGITNGAAWYPIYGSMQDWDYTAAGCMEITLELSQQKRPRTTALPTLWQQNFNALLNFPIAAVLGGISGTVTSSTGAPLTGAVVTVTGNTMTTSARGPLAYYNKPSAPGVYTLTVTAPGYSPASATVTVPANGSGVVRDFVLTPA